MKIKTKKSSKKHLIRKQVSAFFMNSIFASPNKLSKAPAKYMFVNKNTCI